MAKQKKDSVFQKKISELKKTRRNMSAKEIEALDDVTKAALIGETKKMWKREEMFNKALGIYTLWCFVSGTVLIFYLIWKLFNWIF